MCDKKGNGSAQTFGFVCFGQQHVARLSQVRNQRPNPVRNASFPESGDDATASVTVRTSYATPVESEVGSLLGTPGRRYGHFGASSGRLKPMWSTIKTSFIDWRRGWKLKLPIASNKMRLILLFGGTCGIFALIAGIAVGVAIGLSRGGSDE